MSVGDQYAEIRLQVEEYISALEDANTEEQGLAIKSNFRWDVERFQFYLRILDAREQGAPNKEIFSTFKSDRFGGAFVGNGEGMHQALNRHHRQATETQGKLMSLLVVK